MDCETAWKRLETLPAKQKWSLESSQWLFKELGILTGDGRLALGNANGALRERTGSAAAETPQVPTAGSGEAKTPLVVHVVGTNGKGSVCAMLESVLKKAGHSVGLYTSPHLVKPNERMRVNGIDVSDEEFAELAQKVLAVVEKENKKRLAEGQETISEFEATTAMALLFFKKNKVEVAVLEAGMGGRYDATTAVPAHIIVITNVSLDHTNELGGVVEKIAEEKAAAIPPGSVVVTGADEKAFEIVRLEAKRKKAVLVAVNDTNAADVSFGFPVVSLSGTTVQLGGDYGPQVFKTNLVGSFQGQNMALAFATVQQLKQLGLRISEKNVQDGFEQVCWPGRMQVVRKAPLVILDGGHNPAAAREVSHSLEDLFDGKKVVLVVGVLADKDVAGVVWQLCLRASQVVATEPASERKAPASQIAKEARKYVATVLEEPDPEKAFEKGLELAKKTGQPMLVAGSFYLVGEAEKYFGQA